MEQQQEMPEDGRHDALLALAESLRKAALSAGRPDVAAKAQEAIVLVGPSAGSDGGATTSRDTSNTVMRILSGLGF